MQRRAQSCIEGHSGRIAMLAGIAVVSVISGCSSGAFGSPSAVASASGASPTQARIVTIPSCDIVPCQGPLEPATYQASFFQHPIAYRFTVQEPGWTWFYSGNFRIVADDTPTDGLDRYSEGVYVLLDPVAASTTCEEEPEPGVGHSTAQLADWLEGLPGLDVSGRTAVTIGGLEGIQMDLAVRPTWTKTCPFSEGMPAVPLVMRESDFSGYHLTLVPGVSMRWFLLPWEDGVILVDIDESKGRMTREELLKAATPIVESFGFSAA
jgi:hypothetical protein